MADNYIESIEANVGGTKQDVPVRDAEAAHVFGNAGSHNSIYRGNNLGSSITQDQWNAIEAGTFDDLYIGDYWNINGVNWRIAAFDYYYNTGDKAFVKHHAVIVPDTSLYNAQMNDTDTTAGGYAGSKMHTEGLEQAKSTINAAFGAEHVLNHRILFTNGVSNGYPTAGAWADSTVDLMCEQMVYGGAIFMPMPSGTITPYNSRVEKSQLPLFQHDHSKISNISSWWLRDVVTAASFAVVRSRGYAYSNNASGSFGVRPSFCIGV